MGIGVQVTGNKVTVHVVVVSGTWESIVLVSDVRRNSPSDDIPTLLCDLSRALGTTLASSPVEAVVIRRAEHGRATNAAGPKLRLLTEGAITACARQALEQVWLADGKTLAQKSRAANKDDLYAHAKAMLPNVWEDAAAAAVAGIDYYQ